MVITIESTSRLVSVNGIKCRVWEGTTQAGVAVQVLIPRIAVLKDADTSQFDAELQEQRAPSAVQAFDTRMVL
jgi:hypothetical protein